MDFFNETEIRKTLSALKPNGMLFEVRIIENGGKTNYSGYFTDAETLIEHMGRLRLDNTNAYITLNSIKEACYSREQKNSFIRNAKITTSDKDIDGYEWIMIDLDPVRPTGTSSSEAERDKAKDMGNKIFAFLQSQGFYTPLCADSGNGLHLLYKIRAKNSPENVDAIKKFLATVSMLFSDEDVDVDVKNFNPSRICKLYGTLAQKGTGTEERPHRMSGIIRFPDERPNDMAYVKKICNLYPKEDKPQAYNHYAPKTFDLDEWLGRFHIGYRKTSFNGGEKFILDHCPFDQNHKGKDACIFRTTSGAIGFKCFHNSCDGKTWQDVRKLFEPDAYEQNQKIQQRIMYGSHNRFLRQRPEPITPKEGSPVFYTAMDILNLKTPSETFIKTGITEIDKRMRGLKKGYVSVLTGLRGSAKSTLLSEIILNAVDVGNNVGCFSGELSPKNFMRWMYLQAAGKDRVESTEYESYYNVTRQNQLLIASWLGERFRLYNNDYGNVFESIIQEFEKVVKENQLDFLVLDNLMAFNITSLAETKFDAQAAFVWNLQTLAKKHNVHIMFVAHPRKATGFLRLDDISGTGDIGNAVDNAFIIHRNNMDFRRLSKDMFGWKESNPVYNGTNVIEIAKDRDGGTQDVFVPLWYERETKRLKNSPEESHIYGWRIAERKTEQVMLNEFLEVNDCPFTPDK